MKSCTMDDKMESKRKKTVLFVYSDAPGAGHYLNKGPPQAELRGFLF
jgi:hypothetical protein